MVENCKYCDSLGMCLYYKLKFSENKAAEDEIECEDATCPITHPYIVEQVLL